ncbi:MAG: hypothetical protein Kow0089_05620 [Desulfobulbaceae bacterium]
MKRVLPLLILVLLGGCGPATMAPWPSPDHAVMSPRLYRFRLERAGTTRFSGLLAITPLETGVRAVLLDATGLELVRESVAPDGETAVEYAAPPVRSTRLPELLGKLVETLYFTPAAGECSWYALVAVCRADEGTGSRTWKRLGPLHLWDLWRGGNARAATTVRFGLSGVTVHLTPLAAVNELEDSQ